MQHRNSRNVAVIITLLVLLVGTAAVLVCVLVRRSRRKGDELEMAMGYNSRLRASLDEITVTKERMNDVLTSRNAMLLDSFVMLSDHINEVDKFCKASANMIVAGQQGKARKYWPCCAPRRGLAFYPPYGAFARVAHLCPREPRNYRQREHSRVSSLLAADHLQLPSARSPLRLHTREGLCGHRRRDVRQGNIHPVPSEGRVIRLSAVRGRRQNAG